MMLCGNAWRGHRPLGSCTNMCIETYPAFDEAIAYSFLLYIMYVRFKKIYYQSHHPSSSSPAYLSSASNNSSIASNKPLFIPLPCSALTLFSTGSPLLTQFQ